MNPTFKFDMGLSFGPSNQHSPLHHIRVWSLPLYIHTHNNPSLQHHLIHICFSQSLAPKSATMAMNLSASALGSRFVPATASLNLQFVSSRARVCSFPRFLGLKNKSLRAQSSESDSARPNFDVIGTVMELYTAGKVDEAFALLKKLKEEVSNMSNEARYSELIEWLSKTGEHDEAVEFLRKLEEEGVKPEEILSFGDAESELGKLGIHENELREMGLNDLLLELKKRGFDE